MISNYETEPLKGHYPLLCWPFSAVGNKNESLLANWCLNDIIESASKGKDIPASNENEYEGADPRLKIIKLKLYANHWNY